MRNALRPGRLASGFAVVAVLFATAASASPPGAAPRRMLKGGVILCALDQVDCSFTASYGNKELTVEDKTKPSPPPPPPRPAGPLPGQQALLQQAQQRAQPIVININNFNGAEGQAATTTTTRPVAAAGVPPLPPPAAAATANATAGAAAAGPAVGAIVPGGTITNTNGAASG